MSKDALISALREAQNDSKAIESKLRALIRNRQIDADILAIALSRLENFRDDMQTAIEEVQEEVYVNPGQPDHSDSSESAWWYPEQQGTNHLLREE